MLQSFLNYCNLETNLIDKVEIYHFLKTKMSLEKFQSLSREFLKINYTREFANYLYEIKVLWGIKNTDTPSDLLCNKQGGKLFSEQIYLLGYNYAGLMKYLDKRFRVTRHIFNSKKHTKKTNNNGNLVEKFIVQRLSQKIDKELSLKYSRIFDSTLAIVEKTYDIFGKQIKITENSLEYIRPDIIINGYPIEIKSGSPKALDIIQCYYYAHHMRVNKFYVYYYAAGIIREYFL